MVYRVELVLDTDNTSKLVTEEKQYDTIDDALTGISNSIMEFGILGHGLPVFLTLVTESCAGPSTIHITLRSEM
jgi:hypothetical protein